MDNGQLVAWRSW